jgi:hypothetical protein
LPRVNQVVDKEVDLMYPRLLASGKLENRGFGRTHFGEHFVIGEPFQSIATAKPFDMQFGVTEINLERKKVFPFSTTDLQPSGSTFGGS